MKNNLGTVFGLPRLGAGAVVLAICALTSISRADVVINNLNYSQDGILTLGQDPIGQEFTTTSSGGTLTISSVQLKLYNFGSVSASGTIELYATASGLPTGTATLLGNFTISAGDQTVALAPSGVQLDPNTTYAIILNNIPASGMGLEATKTISNSGGSASFGNIYYNDGTWHQDVGDSGVYNWRIDLEAVPEVPMTGMVMGFGALVIALGHTLRRKLRSDVSSIA